MLCSQCQFDNPSGMKFCGQCGNKLESRCSRCNTVAFPGFKFCGECGAALDELKPRPQASTAPEGDGTRRGDEPTRRPEPTGLPTPSAPPVQPTEAVPPEPRLQMRGGSEAALPPAGEPVSMGDSEIKQVSVLHCDLACSVSAIEPELMHHLLNQFFELAREEVERYGGVVSQFLGQGFMALFGAPVAYEDHARRAVLAALGLSERLATTAPPGGRPELGWSARMGLATGAVVVGGGGSLAVGETTLTAGRLQLLAAPGTILVSASTARLVRDLVRLEPVEGIGDEGAMRVATGEAVSEDGRFSSEGLSPFIGRGKELAVLEELRGQAAAGLGQVVAIVGEAGAGKSRLLFEHHRQLRGTGISHLRGRCLSYGNGVPYLPLVDMIKTASNIGEDDEPGVVVAKMRASLETVGTDPETSLPYFLRLLGVSEGTGALDEVEPQALQNRTFATLRRMLLQAAERSLVIMELEDLHWIDSTSAEFLTSLVDVIPAARLFLITTYRPGYQPRWLDKSYATSLTMRRLSPDDSQQLVGAILRRADLPDDLARDILEKAEGNPFFLEELARALVESRAAGAGAAVPDTIQGILMARIDRLPEQHKRLLQTASVLGREINHDLLGGLWNRDEAIDPLLRDLQHWEFLYRAPSEDQAVHHFRHALTQEVAYQSLLSSRRRQLHAQAAKALERHFDGRLEEVYDRLIYHYPKAGEPEKTIHYLTLFARLAARQYAHAEAAKALRQALEHAEELGADLRDRRLVEILLQLADSLLPLAGFPETLELCERYAEHVERVDDPSLTGRYYFWLAHTHTYLGNQEECQRCAHLSIEAAQRCGDEATEGKARYVLGRDGFWSGKFSEGIENSLAAVVLLERRDEPWWQGQAYWVAGFNHYVLGQLADGLAALERALAIGEALDDYRLDTSWSIGYFYASLGDAEQGIEQCQGGLDRSRDPLNTAVAMGFLGHAYLQKPDIEKALAILRSSVEQLETTGMQQILGWFLAFLAEAELADGRPDEARETAERALDTACEASFHYGVGLAQRALGRIALAAKDPAEARDFLTKAKTTFERLEVPFEIARAELELARAHQTEGDGASAATALAGALAIFERLQVPAYVERTRAAAEELGVVL